MKVVVMRKTYLLLQASVNASISEMEEENWE